MTACLRPSALLSLEMRALLKKNDATFNNLYDSAIHSTTFHLASVINLACRGVPAALRKINPEPGPRAGEGGGRHSGIPPYDCGKTPRLRCANRASTICWGLDDGRNPNKAGARTGRIYIYARLENSCTRSVTLPNVTLPTPAT